MAAKVFTIKVFTHRDDRERFVTGTIPELVQSFSYKLECGQSWEREKGNKKINCNPKSIKSLVTNLNNAVNNSAANGYAGVTYYHVDP
jgi:hypothetical protein